MQIKIEKGINLQSLNLSSNFSLSIVNQDNLINVKIHLLSRKTTSQFILKQKQFETLNIKDTTFQLET